MKRYITYKYTLLGIFLLSGSLYIYNPSSDIHSKADNPSVQTLTAYDKGQAEVEQSDDPPRNNPYENDSEAASQTLGFPTEDKNISSLTSQIKEESLGVRGTTISLNESKDSIIKKLGYPGRVVDTEYDFEYYVYNNNYEKLLFVAVSKNTVVGFYTDSLDFNYMGITPSSDVNEVNKALGKSFSIAEVFTLHTDTYQLNLFMDKIGTQKVLGVYLLADKVKKDEFTDSVMKNIELLVYDLTNSVRARNDIPILSWSSSASLSSRKHSFNMAEDNFFDHINPEGQKPGDRIRAEGISYSAIGENIIAGYGTSILSNHAWFNSADHRSVMLNKNYRYLGVGFVYDISSSYKTYITQDYYR